MKINNIFQKFIIILSVLLLVSALGLIFWADAQNLTVYQGLTLPPNELVITNIKQLLSSQISVTELIGKHYQAATEQWQVFYCYQAKAERQTAFQPITSFCAEQGKVVPCSPQKPVETSCTNNVFLFKLDTNLWVIQLQEKEKMTWRLLMQ